MLNAIFQLSSGNNVIQIVLRYRIIMMKSTQIIRGKAERNAGSIRAERLTLKMHIIQQLPEEDGGRLSARVPPPFPPPLPAPPAPPPNPLPLQHFQSMSKTLRG